MIGTSLIGTGYWGSILKKHILEHPSFQLLQEGGSKYPKEKIWNDPETSLVVIATPVDTHFDITVKALKHGKNVLVEKPISLSSERARKIEKFATAKNLRVIVEYTMNFSPALNMLAEGEIDIGGIEAYEMRVGHAGRFYTDINKDVYWLLGSHLLSILDMFEPIDIFNFKPHTIIKNNEIATTGALIFERGILRGSLNHPRKECTVVIYGTKGTATWSSVHKPSLEVTWYKRTPKKLATNLIQTTKTFDTDETKNLDPMLDYVQQVLTRKKETNLSRAIRITEVLEKIHL